MTSPVAITIPNPSSLPLALQSAQMTPSAIKQRIVAAVVAVRPDISARPGGLLDTLSGAFATEQAQVLPALGRMANNTFAQTAQDGGYVVARAAEQGLTPAPGIATVIPVTVTAPAGTVYPAGTRVSTAPQSTSGTPVTFATQTTATVPVGSTSVTVSATCTQVGTVGNISAGAVTVLVDRVAGTTGVTNGAPTTLGVEPESTESLRAHYLSFWQNQPTSGNPASYIALAFQATPAVGNVALVRTPTGPGSVGISLLGTDGLPASSDVVAAVSAYITPTLVANQGKGAIGPTDLQIYAAPAVPISVAVTLTYDPAVVPDTLSEAQVNAAIKAALTAYYAGLAFAGSNSFAAGADALNDVQPDKIAAAIGTTLGVLAYDIGSLRVQGGTSTVAINADAVATLGTLTINGVVV